MTTRIADWLPPALRDAPEQPAGEPRLLDALLAAVEGQRALLADDVARLWDDLFIESCADWAVPYIGALLGLPPDAGRLEVAYAVALRRRKGTPAALEDFAEVLTGWTARVLEGWQITLWAQRLGHPGAPRVATVDLREGARSRIGTPFERVRRSVSPSGPWSPRAATVVVWPWEVRTYLATECAPLGARRFALHPLGAEAPPYLRPRRLRLSSDVGGSAAEARTGDELDAPVRATYAVVEALAEPGQISYGAAWALSAAHPLTQGVAGAPTLLELTADGAPVGWPDIRLGALPPGGPAPAPPAAGQAVVDLARGHVELGAGLAGPLRATWHRPLPGSIGALAGDGDGDPLARVVVTVNPSLPAAGDNVHTLEDAIALAQGRSAALSPEPASAGHPEVEIRLETSDRLDAPPAAAFTPALLNWRVVAPRLMTPTVVGDLQLDLAGGCLTLEGFALSGDLRLGAGLDGVLLRHLTMNPPGGAALRVEPGAWGLALEAELCVLGPVRADLGALPVVLRDCVVDGRGERLRMCGGASAGSAVEAVAGNGPLHPALTASGTTFAGPVRVESVDAADCIFAGGVRAVQGQEGCLRHCFLGPPLGAAPSHPPTYRCGPFPDPTFASVGFEAAGYYAPELEPEHPLGSAAGDGGEVGAYHHAGRAGRIGRLRRRVDEFVPLGLRSRVVLAPWEE